ncbi:unnamed protein product [Lupinus luteus]|uniref:Uncharacterized protein n=1 Tax=Lupinus luteus TaxID=3873 RepID=A0AAV1XDH2_LUPLU
MIPNVTEAKVSSGSRGNYCPFGTTRVKRLKNIDLIGNAPGHSMKALDVDTVKDVTVRLIREVMLKMIVMKVNEIDGAPRIVLHLAASFE